MLDASLFDPFTETGPTLLPRQLTHKQLERLALHPDPRVREGVVRHGNTPIRVLTYLARDANLHVRVAVATSYRAPCLALMLLSRDESPYVQTMVAAHPRTPSAAFDHLVDASELAVRKQAVLHPAVRLPALMRLAMSGVNATDFLDRSNLPVEVIEILVGRADGFGLRVLGCDARTPTALVLSFLHRLDAISMFVVASRRPDIAPFMTFVMHEQIDEYRRQALALASDPSTPVETLAVLSHARDSDLLITIARNPTADGRTLARICVDRLAANVVLKRSVIPQEVLDRVLITQSETLQGILASNPNCPHDVLVELADSTHVSVRLEIAKSWFAPPAAFDELAHAELVCIRKAVARNAAVPRAALEHLARNDDAVDVRSAARATLSRVH